MAPKKELELPRVPAFDTRASCDTNVDHLRSRVLAVSPHATSLRLSISLL